MGAGVEGWLVLYTKPRTEKNISLRLQAQGVHIYCPTRIVLKQWSDRRKKVETPIFPSYVFVKPADEAERLRVLQDPHALSYIHWLGKPAVVSDEEMSGVREFLENGERNNLDVECIQIGQNVQIDSGLFKGQSGVVKSLTTNKLVLELTQLGVQLVMDRKKNGE